MDYECKVCGNTSPPHQHIFREMMFGTRESFAYLECAKCESLQIEQVPENLARFYPHDYYSFSPPNVRQGKITRWLKRQRGRYGMTGEGLIGKCVGRLAGMAPYYQWLKAANLNFDDAILEVGCGSGEMLLRLAADGFTNLSGVDPFIPDAALSQPFIHLHKIEVSQLQGQFDCVIMFHTIEHVIDPLPVLKEMHRLLKPGKIAIIITPVTATYAWKHYGMNWVQLDPPRHIVVFSPQGLRIIAQRSGFAMQRMDFVSDNFMFFGSEQYKLDIPLNDPRSHWSGRRGSLFNETQMREFADKAIELNRANDGDTACCYLKKLQEA